MIFSVHKLNTILSGGTAIKSRIHTNFDKCTGCRICQLACSFALFDGYNPRLARLVIQNKRENLYHIPVVCNQCENAYCMNVCPAKAIQRTDQGTVVIDKEQCIGCGLCAQYCPIEVILFHPETKRSYKCDLCQGNPLCVKVCPTGALEFIHGKTTGGDTIND